MARARWRSLTATDGFVGFIAARPVCSPCCSTSTTKTWPGSSGFLRDYVDGAERQRRARRPKRFLASRPVAACSAWPARLLRRRYRRRRLSGSFRRTVMIGVLHSRDCLSCGCGGHSDRGSGHSGAVGRSADRQCAPPRNSHWPDDRPNAGNGVLSDWVFGAGAGMESS